jgi:hypothetical protein
MVLLALCACRELTILGDTAIDHWFALEGGVIAPGQSAVFRIKDTCTPNDDGVCGTDGSVRIDDVDFSPDILRVEPVGPDAIRVTANGVLATSRVHVWFVDNHGQPHTVGASYEVARGEEVVFVPRCDASYQRAGAEPWALPGNQLVHFDAYALQGGEVVRGDGYEPWNVAPMSCYPNGDLVCRTPAATSTIVVTSPVDPALAVRLAVTAPAELGLELAHLGNVARASAVAIRLSTTVTAAGSPVCTARRRLTVETPDTCAWSLAAPDALTIDTGSPTVEAFARTPTGTCRVRAEIEGGAVSRTVEVPVDAPP